MDQDVARRAEEATQALRDVQRAPAERFELREWRDTEERQPGAAQFQRHADPNELFLAYQIGELTDRVARIDEKQLTPLHVVGAVFGTLATTIGAISGLLAIGKALGVLQ